MLVYGDHHNSQLACQKVNAEPHRSFGVGFDHSLTERITHNRNVTDVDSFWCPVAVINCGTSRLPEWVEQMEIEGKGVSAGYPFGLSGERKLTDCSETADRRP